jgi:transposase
MFTRKWIPRSYFRMISSNFLSREDRHELLSCVKRQREDHGVARRANALMLLDDGKSCVEIAQVLYLDDDTVRGWHKQYLSEGWDAVAYDGWKGGQSRLSFAQQIALCAWLEDRFCRSTVEIRAYVAAQFYLKYSHSGCVKLLARLGFEYRKPKALPRVADVAKQAEFIAMYENMLNSLANDEAVYFAPSRRLQASTCQAMDAVHPEYPSKPAFGWVKKGTNPTLKTTAGRARVNIHGALNLETFDTPFVAPITVDGVSAVQLLAKIEACNQDKRIIHVIWDNAAYHKGPDVRAFLSRKNCRIHLIRLPPDCPHLNPIERLWAVMHQHVTHNRAYPTQKLFTEAILKFFRKIIPEQWHNFRNQVTDNFRIISEQNLRVLE